MVEAQRNNNWQKRLDDVTEDIEKSIRYYTGVRKRTRYMQRFFSTVVMIGSILAPVTVASGSVSAASSNLAVLGIPPQAVGGISLVITLTVALAEGFRRIFRYETRWQTAYTAGKTIRAARQHFFDAVVDLKIGDPQWVAEYRSLRAKIEAAETEEGQEFFKGVSALAAKDQN